MITPYYVVASLRAFVTAPRAAQPKFVTTISDQECSPFHIPTGLLLTDNCLSQALDTAGQTKKTQSFPFTQKINTMKDSRLLSGLSSLPKTLKRGMSTIALLLTFFLIPLTIFGQITQVGTGQSATGTTSVVITKPAGIAVGNLMIATVAYNDNSANGLQLNVAPTSTGWTLIQDVNLDNSNGNDEWRGAVFYKVAVASDVTATNYTFTVDTDADGVVGGIVAFAGVNSGSPFDVAPGTINVTNSNIITATTVTTVTAGSAILMLGMVSDNNALAGWTTTSPGTLTEILDASTANGGDNAVGAAWAIKPAAGATGNGTTSAMAGTDQNGGILLAIRGCTPPSVLPIAGGPANICIGSNPTAFTDATPGGVWSIINGTGSASILQTGVATGVTNGSVTVVYTVTDVNGCSGSATKIMNVGPPAQPSTIVGATGLCANSMGIAYSVTNVPGVTYTWSITGAGWSIASGQGTSSITLNAGATFPQTLTVTPSNNCGNGTARTLVINNSGGTPVYCTECNANCSEPTGDNPDLTGSCADLKIVLVLDESTSIGATYDQDVEAGFMAFVNTLSCTGVELAVVEFNNQARFVLDTVNGVWYHPVDNLLTAAMQNYATGNGTNTLLNGTQTYAPEVGTNYTNWHSAMLAVDHIPEPPNLVIFFTDGVPTKVYLTNPPPNFVAEQAPLNWQNI